MPPLRKFKREDIIDIAYEIVKNEGFENVNARRIAKELNSSVQPIFHNFASMEEVNRAVYEKIYNQYQAYMMSGMDSENPYKAMGMSYIKFARDYPEFFKIIFMQKTNLNVKNFVMADAMGEGVVKAGQKILGLPYEDQKDFHVKVWIFTHGIACLVATKTVEFTDDEIDNLLSSTVIEMLRGYQWKEKEEEN
ncbi:MAG: TetR/AcrR family transcriptional regulator [Clostridia bacterium]|nr:TetR/AcrR family transcriptional regulator [Clostridia bacterium]